MLYHPVFAESKESGIGAFNINLKGFLFQLATFILVVLIFRKWILPKITGTINERQKTLEKSLDDAKKTEAVLAEAETRAEELLTKARGQADDNLAEARKSAEEVIANAEAAATERSAAIIKDAEAHLDQERTKLREQLRQEMAELVAEATTKVVEQKVDARRDKSLIERAIRSIAG